MIKESIAKLIQGKNIAGSEMEAVMEEIMTAQATPAQIASFLTALRIKGESVDEIFSAVKVMRRHMLAITSAHPVILDTCGTGGDSRGTFNISTVSAFVCAGAGVIVAKHGNRGVSGPCGSADLLEILGININLDGSSLARCLSECGIVFLFAQLLHPAMKNVALVRKELGGRTIFNLLGPLTNPAGARHHLLGVFDKKWILPLARVLAKSGSKHALVVCGKDGLDEVSTAGITYVAELKNGRVKSSEIDGRDFGFKRASMESLSGGDKDTNARLTMDVLSGARGPRRDIVLLNAGCAVYAADRARSITEGVKLAQEALDSGAALKKLEMLKSFSS